MRDFTSRTLHVSLLAIAIAILPMACITAIAQEAEAPAAAHVEATHGEAAHGGDPNPLTVDPDLAIWTLVIFLLLFWVLKRFAWPQISAALEERERKIAETVAAAERQLDAAKRLLTEHEAKLAATAGEVRAMLDEARRDAEHTRQRIETEGHRAAEDELKRAVREIGRARDAAAHDLAVVSANIAIDLARGVVRKEISAERQKQIVQEAIGKLSAAAPSTN
jgi:F-type H+-transporting ATPase subunit b